MEDKIKALIEKYEKNANHHKGIADAAKEAGRTNLMIEYRAYQHVEEVTADDLKQLLTTSQGNPESMV